MSITEAYNIQSSRRKIFLSNFSKFKEIENSKANDHMSGSTKSPPNFNGKNLKMK